MTNQFTKAEQQIINAARAYIIKLPSNGKKYTNFAIYTDNGNGLQVLWAKEIIGGDLANAKLFKYQINGTNGKNFGTPCYYFKRQADWNGFSNDLHEMLKSYNPSIQVFNLSGGSPF